MPELPEVETIVRGIEEIKNNKVLDYYTSSKNLRFPTTNEYKKLINKKVKDIKRRARYIIIDFEDGLSLVIHLGMSGTIVLSDKFQKLKHDHFALNFADNSYLIFNDPRRFGFVDLVLSQNLQGHKMLVNLGFEPLDDEFNADYLAQKLKNKNTNIKTTMMDNKIVVGVGNIYINESLFKAGINPQKLAKDLKKAEIKKLVTTIKEIISNAIELGGSSINDYVKSNGELGFFQNNFKVYGRQKENCFVCKTDIVKIVQNGRSTFYCSKCQK